MAKSSYQRFNPDANPAVDEIKAAYEAFKTVIVKCTVADHAREKALTDALSASMFAVKGVFGGIPGIETK